MTEIADLIQQQFVFVIQKATPDDPVVCPLVVQRDVSSQAAAERTQQLSAVVLVVRSGAGFWPRREAMQQLAFTAAGS